MFVLTVRALRSLSRSEWQIQRTYLWQGVKVVSDYTDRRKLLGLQVAYGL